MTSGSIRHGVLVAAFGARGWRGVLLEGPSGAGKSDLALRLLDAGWRLVADDRVETWASAGRPFGRAPDTLAGLMEVRGLDVIRLPRLAFAEIALLAASGEPERIPEPATAEVAGLAVPAIALSFREASAPAKLSRALALFDADPNRRMKQRSRPTRRAGGDTP
jgi:hypothetical protein